MKKREENGTTERSKILEMCYTRLKELIPECENEVTLIKCIEILEKHELPPTQDDKQRVLAIASTLERLAELK